MVEGLELGMCKFFCSCCYKETDDFYINSKTGKRNKYCNQCYKDYTRQERSKREKKYIFGIIAEMEI